MLKKYTIAIDGPAGAGKSTVARGVAQALGHRYVDTGSMYRAITLLALQKNVDLNDQHAMNKLAENAKIEIVAVNGDQQRLLLNSEDVTEKIRDPLVTGSVSKVASIPGVRKVLTSLQSALASGGGVVMEGRDIGTVVMPDADFKFYTIASTRERAGRRAMDLEKMGHAVDFEKLIEEIDARDYTDSNREINPLKPADDAEIIDCTAMSAQEVIDFIVHRVTGGRI